MKKLYYILTLLLCSSSLFGQSPELMSYQAIIRNASDQLVVNQNVGVRISILQGSETGSTVYTETHTESTNDNGLVTLNIGAGNTSDDFSNIDWGNGTYFIKSETDPTGGTNYSIEGTSQLLSVPYALYAKSSGNSGGSPVTVTPDNTTKTVIKTGELIVVYTDSNAYGFSQYEGGNSSWNSRSLSGTPIGAVVSDKSIIIYTDTNAYAFSQYEGGNSSWTSTSLSGTPIGAQSSKDNIVVYTDTNAYGFSQYNGGNGSWNSTSLSGTPIGSANSNKNIVVYTDSNAYGFSQYNGGNGSWNSTSLSGTPIDALGASNTIVVFTSSNAYGFSQYNDGNGSWNSRSLSGTPIGISGQ